jgi:hypothetical protein
LYLLEVLTLMLRAVHRIHKDAVRGRIALQSFEQKRDHAEIVRHGAPVLGRFLGA